MIKSSVVLMLALSVAASAQTSNTKSTASKSTAAKKSAAATAPAGPPKAIFHTSMGDIHCTLAKDKVPNAVANFIGLANGTKDWTDPKTGQKVTGKPLYDNTTFHRVIPEFMIQGGDPLGTGMGDPGYKIKDEFSPDLKFDKAGVLAYANSGPNTNGSQFFITEVPYEFLNPCLDDAGCVRGNRQVPKGYGYTIFGQCSDPDVVQQIARVPRSHAGDSADKPLTPVVIKHVEIIGAPKPGTTHKPAAKKSTGAAKKSAPKKSDSNQ